MTAVDRRNARWYLTGLGFSLVGDTALSLVAGIWAKSLTGSSAVAGLVMACIYVPSLFGPVAGLVADRLPQQRFIVVVNLCTAIAVGSLLMVRGAEHVWLLGLIMLAYGSSLVLMDPAENALVAQMFPAAMRQQVNGWRLGMQETGRLVAPLAGAGLFAAFGGRAVAALDALTFLIAAWTTSQLRPPPAPSKPPRGRWRTDLAAGFGHLRIVPRLRLLVTVAASVMAVSGTGVAAQFSMVAELHRAPEYLGVFSALLGAGSVVASLASSRMISRFGLERLAVAGLLAFTIGTGLRAVPTLSTAWVGSFVLGFALPWVFLATLNAAQQLTPDHLQGRVAAAVSMLLFAPQALTQTVGSLMIVQISYNTIYAASAVCAAVLSLVLVLGSRRRAAEV